MHCPSYEASVLFPGPVAYGSGNLHSDLAILAEAHDMTLQEIKTEDSRFRLFDFGEIQILIAAQRDPMEPAHFLDARRPTTVKITDTQVMRRLTSHRFVVTVLVADNPDLNLPDTVERATLRHRLCWQITEGLRHEGDASLVFWCDNDTIYGTEEFENADLFGSSEPIFDDEGEIILGGILDAKKMIEAKALTYMDAKIVQGAHRPLLPPEEPKSHVGDLVRAITRPLSRILRRKDAA